MSKNFFDKTSKKDEDDEKAPLGTARQLPAPESSNSRHTPLGTARQLPAPEASDNSCKLPIRTSRRLAPPVSPSDSEYAPLKTSRQLPAPESSHDKSTSTNRDTLPKDSLRKESYYSRNESSHHESSRCEPVRHEYSRQKSLREESRHDDRSRRDSFRKETSGATESVKKSGVSRVVESLDKGTSRSTQTVARNAGPSRVTEALPSNNKKKKSDLDTLPTSYAVVPTRKTTNVGKTQLPEYATRGLTQQQLEVQQVLVEKVRCIAGFVWLKQKMGWRCEAGNHWMTDDQAERIARGEDPGVVGSQFGPGPPETMTNMRYVKQVPPHPLPRHQLLHLNAAGRSGHCDIPDWARRNLTQEQIETQKKLSEILPCPEGYIWLKKRLGSWDCAGGNHDLTDEEVERLCAGETIEDVFWYRHQGVSDDTKYCILM